MSKTAQKATELFSQGYSCSESVIRAASEVGLIDQNIDINLLTRIATPFSGGMGSGCLCGAVSGAQIAIGTVFGRENNTSPRLAKEIAQEFVTRFKDVHKTTCCRALSKSRDNCTHLVAFCAELLETLVQEKTPQGLIKQ